MKQTATEFIFKSTWDGMCYLTHEGEGMYNGTTVNGVRSKPNGNFVDYTDKLCEVGSKLCRWLGEKEQEVTITITKKVNPQHLQS